MNEDIVSSSDNTGVAGRFLMTKTHDKEVVRREEPLGWVVMERDTEALSEGCLHFEDDLTREPMTRPVAEALAARLRERHPNSPFTVEPVGSRLVLSDDLGMMSDPIQRACEAMEVARAKMRDIHLSGEFDCDTEGEALRISLAELRAMQERAESYTTHLTPGEAQMSNVVPGAPGEEVGDG
jgi:hypothetical protein